jgi:hypothetical protein
MKNYQVIAAFGRRRDKESAASRYESMYPEGVWWLTGSLVWEFRLYNRADEC